MKFLLKISVIFHLSTVVFGIADQIGCRDEDGNLVDWFYIYKLPKIEGKSETGLKYLFVTSSSSEWTMSQKLMNDSSSMVGKTFEEIYRDRKDNKIKLLYNDEPPTGTADEVRGHTKGVVVANDISGFWMIHSVPKFPSEIEKGAYDFPESGRTCGQSSLCISMTGDQIWKVGKQLQFNEPHFYSFHVPDNLRLIYPELVEALKMQPRTSPPFYNIEIVQSRNKTEFLSFAKSRKFQKELYEDLAAPYFKSGSYFVESWRHGTGNIDSDCSKPSKVYNIEQVTFKNFNISFPASDDHSKWMASDEKKLICVGDINRQTHQKFRGGGTVCQKAKISKIYVNLIAKVEKCKESESAVPCSFC